MPTHPVPTCRADRTAIALAFAAGVVLGLALRQVAGDPAGPDDETPVKNRDPACTPEGDGPCPTADPVRTAPRPVAPAQDPDWPGAPVALATVPTGRSPAWAEGGAVRST